MKLLLRPNNRDCCLIIEAMPIRKQTLWNPEKDEYSGFINFGDAIPKPRSDKLASEALVFLLVGTRSHWKSPLVTFWWTKSRLKTKQHW